MVFTIYLLTDTKAVSISNTIEEFLGSMAISYRLKVFDFILDTKKLSGILDLIKEDKNVIIYHSFKDPKLSSLTKSFAESMGLPALSFKDYLKDSFASILNNEDKSDVKLLDLNEKFRKKRLDALDFALKFDDGQDFRGLKCCDIAIIGVSRSSKTPLSMYLASKGYRVSNIPIMFDSKVPQELFEINPQKIFGLTIDKNVLKKIREERLKSLKLSKDSIYSSKDRIDSEIDYALELMDDIGCTIIDVTYRSIEETSEIIIGIINQNKEK